MKKIYRKPLIKTVEADSLEMLCLSGDSHETATVINDEEEANPSYPTL